MRNKMELLVWILMGIFLSFDFLKILSDGTYMNYWYVIVGWVLWIVLSIVVLRELLKPGESVDNPFDKF